MRQLHKVSTRFESITDLCIKLIEELKKHVPSTVDYIVGYYDGSQQAKVSLVNSDDLKAMYERYSNGGSVTLWCNGRQKEDECLGKRKREGKGKNHQEREEKVDSVFQKLISKSQNIV